ERVGAFTIPGPHHRDTGSQDSFWPTNAGDERLVAGLSRFDIAQHGRLYILADGVSLCADGQAASRIAVKTAGDYYYQTAGAYPNTDAGRIQRLEDAVWQAHLRVSDWDERYFCWRAERHPDGVSRHFKKEQMSAFNPPICPLCNLPVVGLQTTILAALVRGNQLLIVGVGDCSAFRLPFEIDYGVEWIYTPQDGQFLGMSSLTRQSIMGQSFVLSPGDRALLASDGMVKVLNGLHSDMGWHNFLRQRLNENYQAEVQETILDLDGWRLSKPRQRKLHDDLTLVAVELLREEPQQAATENAMAQYDALYAQQESGNLSESDFEAFIHSAETALAHDDSQLLNDLYRRALHSYALTRLGNTTKFDDGKMRELLQHAAQATPSAKDWVTVYRRLSQIDSWIHDEAKLSIIAPEQHTQLVSDMYAVDFHGETPPLVSRIMEMMGDLAGQLDARNMPTAASQYRSFANYLSNQHAKTTDVLKLPAREAIGATTSSGGLSTEEENTQALELQITEAISNGRWEIAQELIIELNKLKGARLSQDTEGVDTSPTRPTRSRSSMLQPATAGALPTSMPMRKRAPAANTRRTEVVMPFAQVQRVFHSREPVALVRDSARAAFSESSADYDLGMAFDLMREAGRLYPHMRISENDWKALWQDQDTDFSLPDKKEADESAYEFSMLADHLQIARDIAILNVQSSSADLRDLNHRQARNDMKLLEQWRNTLEQRVVPHQIGLGALWQASQLIQMRLDLKEEPLLSEEPERLTPYERARASYSEALWQALLAQGANNRLRSTHSTATNELLDGVIQLRENPWSQSAATLQQILQKEHLIVRAYDLHNYPAPENATTEEVERLEALQDHVVSAAWEMVAAMAEHRIPIERDMLQLTQNELVSAPYNVSEPNGRNGLRLRIIYSLLSLLIHDPDGPIVNGFYAYEIRVPRQLNSDDFKRLSDVRSNYITRAWETTLAEAGKKQPFYLPASGRIVSRVKPDRATPEGRRLQAVRALLPKLSQAYDDWIDYALFLYDWRPPIELADVDQEQFNGLLDHCAKQAWHYVLDAIRGNERPEMNMPRLQGINSRLHTAQIDPDRDQRVGTRRLAAIRNLLPLLMRLKAPNSLLVSNALSAQRAFIDVSSELSQADAALLNEACEAHIENLWTYCLDLARDSVDGDEETISAELEAFEAARNIPAHYESTWNAAHNLLKIAQGRQVQRRSGRWDTLSDTMFTAFETVNLQRDLDKNFEAKNQQMYELSYYYLADWKDSLPVQPNLWSRRRVNAEKRRIQEYWLVRKEYGM
ncbi:MAG: protein phosphatase 2C domain-containing protein, partial [Candidatus Promineifilaceae bacterium]